MSTGAAAEGPLSSPDAGGHPSESPSPALHSPLPLPAPSASAQSRSDALRAEGNAHYSARRFQSAVWSYSHAAILAPDCATIYSNRAAAWMGMRRWTEARADCNAALQLDPAMEKARARLAKIDVEEARHLAGAAAASSTAAATTAGSALEGSADAAFSTAQSLAACSPAPSRLVVRSNLPHGKGNGVFVAEGSKRGSGTTASTSATTETDTGPNTVQPGEVLFECEAAAVCFDDEAFVEGDGSASRSRSRDLLHALLIAATLDPAVHRSLRSLFPHSDAHLESLPLVSMADSNPEEAQLWEAMVDAAPSGTHPGLVVPPYARLMRLSCGRFTPMQIHLLHHQVLYNSFALGDGGAATGAGGGNSGGRVQARRGVALYPAASLLNHSCWPNSFGAVLEGEERRMVVRATRPIHGGDECTLSYMHLIGPRAARRKLLWEAFEFLCQCERCDRSASAGATAAASVHPAHRADDLLEALVCTNAACPGPDGMRGQRGTMYRREPAGASGADRDATAAEELAAQSLSADFLPEGQSDRFECADCGASIPLAEVEGIVGALSTRLASLRSEFQAAPSLPLAGLDQCIDAFQSLLDAAESRLRAPTHWLLPQLYSALGGLWFQRSRALLRDGVAAAASSSPAPAAAAQSQAQAPVSAAELAAQRTRALTQASRFAAQAYHSSKAVLPVDAIPLVPLLLTAAAAAEQTAPRLAYLQEALRIHSLHFGGGLDLFRQRHRRDFDRLAVSADALQQLQSMHQQQQMQRQQQRQQQQ